MPSTFMSYLPSLRLSARISMAFKGKFDIGGFDDNPSIQSKFDENPKKISGTLREPPKDILLLSMMLNLIKALSLGETMSGSYDS